MLQELMKNMRIAQLVSNMYPTNRFANKAIYSHAGMLSDKLVERGHDVHVFGSNESETKAQLHATSQALAGMELGDDAKKYRVLEHISRCYEFSKENIDVIHSHFTLLSSFFSDLSGIPTLISVHSPIEERIRPFLEAYKNNKYISFSLAQRKLMPELNWYANIYHGVDTDIFAFEPEAEDYFLYMGRITADKGVHCAIEAAKIAGVNLRIAGTSYPSEGYWQKSVEPHVNGESIRYFGEMSFEAKIPLLQKAKALLFPISWNEPFGYAMIEAMSCGTPVIGFNNGSVPEIVQNGETGFVVENAEDMAEAIKNIGQIDRAKVRKRAERYFSAEKMVSGYEKIYQRVIDENSFKQRKKIQRILGTKLPHFPFPNFGKK